MPEEPNQPTETNEPAVIEQPVVSVPEATPSPAPVTPVVAQPKTSFIAKLKKLGTVPLVAIIAVVVLAAGAGAYFGFVLPAKPENIWKKALSNTAKGYDKVVDQSRKNMDVKGLKLKGDFKVDTPEVVIDGNIDVKLYDKDSDVKIDAGASGQRFSLNLLTHVPDGSKNPDIYAKVNGLKGIDALLGDASGGLGSQLASIDDQWLVVDHTFLDQLEKQVGADASASIPEFTPEDMIALQEAVGRANRQHLLTDDPTKAVFKVTEKVGKEKLDNRGTYHFKVGYDKNNLKSYLTALKDEVKKTKLNEFFKDKSLEESLNFDSLLSSVDKLSGEGTADVWVDTKTKLIRKIRFTDKENKDNRVDLGLNYNGGDDLPFSIDVVSKEDGAESNFGFKATFNYKKYTSEYNINFDYKQDGKSVAKITSRATLEQNNDKIDFKKPDNAKSLLELMGGFSQLLGGIPMGSGGANIPSSGNAACDAAIQAYVSSGGTTQIPANCL